MKKGRHRRFEEARALKRSHEVDLHDLFDSISDAPEGEHKPEHDAWADLAEEWDNKQSTSDETTDDTGDTGDDDEEDADDDSATSESEAAS